MFTNPKAVAAPYKKDICVFLTKVFSLQKNQKIWKNHKQFPCKAFFVML